MADELLTRNDLLAGRYRMIRRIARGGMGSVWQASDERAFGQNVAVKVLRGDFVNANSRKQFEHEAELTSRLVSPHVVTLREFGFTQDDHPFFVMDLLDGETLLQRTKRLTRIPMREAARIIDEVLAGLQDIHALGVLHRDIKPGNIFLESSAGVDGRVRLLDLGIAQMSHDDPKHLEVNEGTVIGTPKWMAPEIIVGREPSISSDLYAVALVFIRILGGVIPHTNPDTPSRNKAGVNFMKRRVKTPEVDLTSLYGMVDVPMSICAVLETALAYKALDRYPSALDFRHALRVALPELRLTPLPHEDDEQLDEETDENTIFQTGLPTPDPESEPSDPSVKTVMINVAEDEPSEPGVTTEELIIEASPSDPIQDSVQDVPQAQAQEIIDHVRANRHQENSEARFSLSWVIVPALILGGAYGVYEMTKMSEPSPPHSAETKETKDQGISDRRVAQTDAKSQERDHSPQGPQGGQGQAPVEPGGRAADLKPLPSPVSNANGATGKAVRAGGAYPQDDPIGPAPSTPPVSKTREESTASKGSPQKKRSSRKPKPKPKPKSKRKKLQKTESPPRVKPVGRKALDCATELKSIGRASAKGSVQAGSKICARITRLARRASQGKCTMSGTQQSDLKMLGMLCGSGP